MEAIRLFILKIILSSIILNVLAASYKHAKQNNHIQSTEKNNENALMENDKMLEKTATDNNKPARTTRNAYRKNWSKSYLGSANNMPPYLVFNRKTGSYFPYYTYPKENSVRRSGYKNLKKWSH